MLNSPAGLFDKVDDKKLHSLLAISVYERRHGIKAVRIAIPATTLEQWEEAAGEPIGEIREWPVEGGPYTEIQVTFDNGWIKSLVDIVKETSAW